MRVYHFTSTTGDFAPSPIRGWVMCEDAEAEIEKARREGRDEVLQSRLSEHWPNVQKRLEESARADERERIRAEYKRLREDHLAAEAAELAMGEIETAQKPKPLEKLEHGADFETGLGLSREGVAKLNALVDAVNDLIRRIPKP